MRDQFFTPLLLAETAVNAVRVRKVETVADFAAGHGDLLKAARARWPNCLTFGNDIDASCARKLAQFGTVAEYSNCDFLNDRSTSSSRRLMALKGKCDVVLLNPPFSGRGNATLIVETGFAQVSCSRAMAFVYRSIPYLRCDGEIVAFLPASCLTSEKDAEIRKICMAATEMEAIESFSHKAFEKCSASTVVVRFRKRFVESKANQAGISKKSQSNEETLPVRIIRGCVPVYRAENGFAGKKYPFIHSTDILGGSVCEYERSVRVDTRIVNGPAVLIARVGSPATRKCGIYNSQQAIVLSDCLIALQCDSLEIANKVRERILSRWDRFALIYGGTCAPYLTIDALTAFLLRNSIVTFD